MNVINFLKVLKESFNGAEMVYSQGSCYKLYEILKELENSSTPLINKSGQHIITVINNKAYDINGEVLDFSKFQKLTEVELKYFKNRRFDVFSPNFFVPEWVVDSCIPFLQTAQFAFNLDVPHKLIEIKSDLEMDQIEQSLFTINVDSYKPYVKMLEKEQNIIRNNN